MKQVIRRETLLAGLGERLRTARLERNDSMALFAERLGVSEATVRAMEKGLPTVQIGTWLNALWILDRAHELDSVLASRASLPDQARDARRPVRQRASRRPA